MCLQEKQDACAAEAVSWQTRAAERAADAVRLSAALRQKQDTLDSRVAQVYFATCVSLHCITVAAVGLLHMNCESVFRACVWPVAVSCPYQSSGPAAGERATRLTRRGEVVCVRKQVTAYAVLQLVGLQSVADNAVASTVAVRKDIGMCAFLPVIASMRAT